MTGMGLLVGSTIGSLIPSLWGASMFSFSSLVLGALGGMAGIYIAFKMTN